MSRKIKISIIGSVGIPAQYGGFETLAEQLCKNMVNFFRITVFCSRKIYSLQERKTPVKYAKRVFLNNNANGISSIVYDLKGILKSIRKSEIILVLGGSAGIFFPLIHLIKGKTKIIFHPDGLEWKRKKWNILIRNFLMLSINTACRFSDKIILDNQALLKYYLKYKSKTVLIPYGGDQFNYNPHKNSNTNYWLTIARAEPENNLDMICKVFQKLKDENLIIISNWQDSNYGKLLMQNIKNYSNIRLLPAIYDIKILSEYLSNCKGYIHGHSSGGTNPSLVTAMWIKKPLICHDNEFNRSTTMDKCFYFKSEFDLFNRINKKKIVANPELFKIAKEQYTWQLISNMYRDIFIKIL